MNLSENVKNVGCPQVTRLEDRLASALGRFAKLASRREHDIVGVAGKRTAPTAQLGGEQTRCRNETLRTNT